MYCVQAILSCELGRLWSEGGREGGGKEAWREGGRKGGRKEGREGERSREGGWEEEDQK